MSLGAFDAAARPLRSSDGCLYTEPRWFLEQIGPDVPGSFYVALRSEGGEESQRIKVVGFDSEEIQSPKYKYRLPGGHLYCQVDGRAPTDVDFKRRI